MSIQKEKTPAKKVTDRFNYLLKQRRFYDSEIFPENDLPTSTYETLQAADSDFAIILGNRMLLEQVFPTSIIRTLRPFNEITNIDRLENPDSKLPHSKFSHDSEINAAIKELRHLNLYNVIDEVIRSTTEPEEKKVLVLYYHKDVTIENTAKEVDRTVYYVRQAIKKCKSSAKKVLELIGE